MITLDRERGPLCLGCADVDHLEFLPSGDAAVTRRTSKHSHLDSYAVGGRIEERRPLPEHGDFLASVANEAPKSLPPLFLFGSIGYV